ncbi:MAG: hydrogenase iron-sulfur subunit [Anaerolineales bacterium]
MTEETRIVVMGCERSAGPALEDLQAGGYILPEEVEWIEIPCGGNIDVLHILRAFESGADRVMILACHEGACHSLDGNRWAAKRVEAARKLVVEAGLPAKSLIFHNLAPNMGADLAGWLHALLDKEIAETAT